MSGLQGSGCRGAAGEPDATVLPNHISTLSQLLASPSLELSSHGALAWSDMLAETMS